MHFNDIYSATAYADTAKQYADLFYGLDMLTVKDFERTANFRNVAYKMKNDDRRGGEPNPLIKEELLKKEDNVIYPIMPKGYHIIHSLNDLGYKTIL